MSAVTHCPRCGLTGAACKAQADAEWQEVKRQAEAYREAKRAARRVPRPAVEHPHPWCPICDTPSDASQDGDDG